MFSLRNAISTLAVTTIITQLVNAATVLLQAHFYSPASLGVLSNILSVATILAPLCSLQLAFAIPQQHADRDVLDTAALTLLSTFASVSILGLLGAAVIALGHGPVAINMLIWWWGIGLVPLFVSYDLIRLVVARTGEFRAVGMLSIALAALRAATLAVGGVLGGAGPWLVLAEALSRAGSLSVATRWLTGLLRAARVQPLRLGEAFRRNWRFPAVSTPSSLLDNLGGYLPPILIGTLYGVATAGQFFLAQRVVSLPILLLVQTTSDIMQVRAAQIVHDDKRALWRFVARAAAAFFALGLCLVAAIALFVWGYWGWIFSSHWAEARSFSFVLLMPGLLQAVTGPLSRVLVVANRQLFKLAFDISYLSATLLPALVETARGGLTAGHLITWMAWGYVAAYSVYAGIILLAALRPLDVESARP